MFIYILSTWKPYVIILLIQKSGMKNGTFISVTLQMNEHTHINNFIKIGRYMGKTLYGK